MQQRFSLSNFNDRVYAIVGLMIITILILTLVSFFELCSEECAEGHNYRIFGFSFETFGLVFFGFIALIHIMSRWYSNLTFLVSLCFAGALGAEVMFILFQKYTIGSWCPVCLSIAACVFIAAAALSVSYLKEYNASRRGMNKEKTMKNLTRGVLSTAVVFIGFFASFMGITKYDELQAAEATIKESLEFGDINSPIEVYLFTDWACPACRKLEGHLEPMTKAIMQQATFVFVDHVVHPETLNFIPFNLSFLINNKPEYFKLRRMLTAISEETGSPQEQEISDAAKKIGVTYTELNYSDIALGIKYFKNLGVKFKIKGTPTMIILNKDAKKGKKLVGNDEISEENALNAIETLKKL